MLYFPLNRWIVLTFKREFPFKDALTMFEIISSQHLELSSMEAERERERQRAKELERDGERICLKNLSILAKFIAYVSLCNTLVISSMK